MKLLNLNRKNNIQLTQEDYENIWLRIKEKGKLWLFGWVSLISALIAIVIGFGINDFIKQRVDSEITSLINSDTFRKEIIASLQEKLTNSNKNYSELLDKNHKYYLEITNRINKLAMYRYFPVKCYKYGFEFLDTEGKTIKVEYGYGTSNKINNFIFNFINTPIVFVTQNKSSILNRTSSISLNTVSKKSFSIKNTSKSYDILEYNWLAIGE